MNPSIKLVDVSHNQLFQNAADIYYDMVLVSGEPHSEWAWLFDNISSPQKFVHAVTSKSMAGSYFTIGFLESLGENDVIIIRLYGKLWATVLAKNLDY